MAQSGKDSLKSTLAGGSDSLKSSLAGGHDYMFDFCCDLCERDGLQMEAVGYCADCQDYLCTECFNTHLRPKPSRHHVLLDRHQMPKDQQQNIGGDSCTEICATHPHKTVEYYCAQHDELGCSVCMTLNHRICKGVDHIPDVASDILNSVEYVEFQTKVTSLTKVATTAIQTSLDQSQCSKTYHAKAIQDFRQFQTDLSKAVDTIEKNFTKEADRIKDDDEKKMKLSENKYQDVLTDIQALSSKFISLQNNGQFCQLFIAMKRAKRDTVTIETRIDESELNMNARNYKLITSNEIQLLLNTPEAMVKLEINKEVQPGLNPIQTANSFMPAALQQDKQSSTTRAEHVKDIEVGSTGDFLCSTHITGCAVLSDDNLVVVDAMNDNVNLIDLPHNVIVSQLELPYVWDITKVNSSKVAVTSPDTETIFFVNINANQLKLYRKVKVRGQCRGISSINDKLVVSYGKPAKVEIISMKGKVLQTVISEEEAGQISLIPGM